MRIVVRLMVVATLGIFLFGCSSKGGDQPQGSTTVQKGTEANNQEFVLKYLRSVQAGDKDKMYEAANLTTEIVNDSREKLIHPAKYNLNDTQRKDAEHALRTSGNISFLSTKFTKILPKSASFQITKTTARGNADGITTTDHSIKVTYGSKEEAVRDKTGKTVKELVLHLLQLSRPLNGRPIHDFSFDTKDFEKMADRDFEVISYF